MKYSFSAEIDAPNDMHIKTSFNSDDARDLRSEWQGIQSILFDLTRVGIINAYAMEAAENTADTWEEGGYI